jgi:hypothetical protein
VIREALGTAVALGLADEGGRGLDAEEGQLALEVVGDELAAVVVTERETGSDGGSSLRPRPQSGCHQC